MLSVSRNTAASNLTTPRLQADLTLVCMLQLDLIRCLADIICQDRHLAVGGLRYLFIREGFNDRCTSGEQVFGSLQVGADWATTRVYLFRQSVQALM